MIENYTKKYIYVTKTIGDIQVLIKNPSYKVYSNNIGYYTIGNSQESVGNSVYLHKIYCDENGNMLEKPYYEKPKIFYHCGPMISEIDTNIPDDELDRIIINECVVAKI